MSQLVVTDTRFSVNKDTINISQGYAQNGVAVINDIQQYFPDNSMVPSWNRGKPKFMSFLQTILNPLYAAIDVFSNFDYYFSIDNATGEQLDMIGRLVGCSRVLPYVFIGYSRTLDDDDDYRLLIKATIAKQHWDGTLSGMIDIMNSLFGYFDISIIDNQDCSFNLKINSSKSVSGVQMQMILSDLLFPHAAGVKMYVDIPASISAAQIGISAGVYEIGKENFDSAEV